MRKRITLYVIKAFIVILSILGPSMAVAANIVSVQSINIKPYNDVLKGFKKACDCDVTSYVLSEMRSGTVKKEINTAKPDLILTIGLDAFESVRGESNFPIIYSMLPDLTDNVSGNAGITGISMNISAARQLQTIKNALPELQNIGLLYNPETTGHFVEEALHAAKIKDITLSALQVRNPKDILRLLDSMKEKIDAFWMLPDLTVVTPDTVKLLMLFSINNRIPVITFSNKYAEMGALLALEIDTYDIGRQAGETAVKILSGTNVRQIAISSARNVKITINRNTARKLEIDNRGEIFKSAKASVWEQIKYAH